MPPPPWLKSLMLYHIARLVCVQTHYRIQLRKQGSTGSRWSLTNKNNPTTVAAVNMFNARPKTGRETTNGDILDEMENIGLTAVLSNRCPNGPSRVDYLSETQTPNARPHFPSNHVDNNELLQHANSTHPRPGLPLNNHRMSTQLHRRPVLHDPSPVSEVTDDDLDRGVIDRYSRDWHEVAHVLDRFFFWVLLILMTLSTVIILFYPQYSGLEKEQLDITM